MLSRPPSSGGFTLIEVLAVVGILSILVAIALANLGPALERARIGKAIADISTINKAIQSYRAGSGGDLPANMNAMIPRFIGAVMNDPWGYPYVYNNFDYITPGQRRKDGPLVPINSEYDIYSIGPNGQTNPTILSNAGKDDIIFAQDGGFIDVAENY